jgi:hypothetical protein
MTKSSWHMQLSPLSEMLHLNPESAVPHISLVFREMWDTTALHVRLSEVGKKVKVRGIPHLAKNERDMGHPRFVEGKETDRPSILLRPDSKLVQPGSVIVN